jgi:hypothetical protein
LPAADTPKKRAGATPAHTPRHANKQAHPKPSPGADTHAAPDAAAPAAASSTAPRFAPRGCCTSPSACCGGIIALLAAPSIARHACTGAQGLRSRPLLSLPCCRPAHSAPDSPLDPAAAPPEPPQQAQAPLQPDLASALAQVLAKVNALEEENRSLRQQTAELRQQQQELAASSHRLEALEEENQALRQVGGRAALAPRWLPECLHTRVGPLAGSGSAGVPLHSSWCLCQHSMLQPVGMCGPWRRQHVTPLPAPRSLRA